MKVSKQQIEEQIDRVERMLANNEKAMEEQMQKFAVLARSAKTSKDWEALTDACERTTTLVKLHEQNLADCKLIRSKLSELDDVMYDDGE